MPTHFSDVWLFLLQNRPLSQFLFAIALLHFSLDQLGNSDLGSGWSAWLGRGVLACLCSMEVPDLAVFLSVLISVFCILDRQVIVLAVRSNSSEEETVLRQRKYPLV